jgi:hypothetical protein
VGKKKRDAKTKTRARRATFVRGKEHLNMATLTVMPKTLNVVHRAALNPNPPTEEGGEWGSTDVFFKPHHDEDAVSQYAVASTRLARFLGMPDVIARNAFARVKGSPGVVSGAVPGSPLVKHKHDREQKPPKNASRQQIAAWVKHNQLEERGGKYYAMSQEIYEWIDFRSPRIQKGLSDLQLFDAITGQLDRHGGNIFIDPQTGQVSGIDDDKSFGEGMSVANQGNTGGKYAGLPALVDEETARGAVCARERLRSPDRQGGRGRYASARARSEAPPDAQGERRPRHELGRHDLPAGVSGPERQLPRTFGQRPREGSSAVGQGPRLRGRRRAAASADHDAPATTRHAAAAAAAVAAPHGARSSTPDNAAAAAHVSGAGESADGRGFALASDCGPAAGRYPDPTTGAGNAVDSGGGRFRRLVGRHHHLIGRRPAVVQAMKLPSSATLQELTCPGSPRLRRGR